MDNNFSEYIINLRGFRFFLGHPVYTPSSVKYCPLFQNVGNLPTFVGNIEKDRYQTRPRMVRKTRRTRIRGRVQL